ncbi:MAG: N-terminal beta barrel domain [Actinomycetospora sp.]|nr:N-terminal beta barrel domain [Actinomycetospora sp.]
MRVTTLSRYPVKSMLGEQLEAAVLDAPDLPFDRRHRVEVPGFGMLPCAGVYAEVVHGGPACRGDAVVLR